MLERVLGMVRLYEQSEINQVEFRGFLIDAVADLVPANVAPRLPARALDELRDISKSPEDAPVSITLFKRDPGADVDRDAEENGRREFRRRLCDGLWRWHRYFAETPD